MPLSPEQRRKMDIHIRSNTAFNRQADTDYYTGRNFIIDSMERLLDSTLNLTRDLFLPNSFIDGCISSFWLKMASIMCAGGFSDWHELEYGAGLNRHDLRERYVYTWTYKGDTYRFYTRVLRSGSMKELAWYINKSTDQASGDDTDTEDVMLQVYP